MSNKTKEREENYKKKLSFLKELYEERVEAMRGLSLYQEGIENQGFNGVASYDTSQLTQFDSFVQEIADGVIQGWHKSKILPSVSAAQAILESGRGKSDLAVKGNNLFGIKAGGGWSGQTISMPTKEQTDGGRVYVVNAAFRKYNSWSESVLDHSSFFIDTEARKNRYKKVVGETNYKKAAQALKDAGYATDVNYPSKLIRVIESENLTLLDQIAFNATTISQGITAGGKEPVIAQGVVIIPAGNRSTYSSNKINQKKKEGVVGFVPLDFTRCQKNLSGCTMTVAKEAKPIFDFIFSKIEAAGIFKGKIKINSAFRNESSGTSYHRWGGAIDIGVNGTKQAIAVADICWTHGLRAVAIGGNVLGGAGFVHIDVGPGAQWNYSNLPTYKGTESWAKYR